ncbi:YdeI/OmpD-associated family protein [Nocardia mangyaensis]|uniref:YdeI/OmpD-associated family protein n=1 Tax=Nocardia mangyaensis TaxID=2213200 RepID=UPI0026765729|nr:OmdA domain containing protein [Nocardia mangyaensis]MDO3651127.1 OmdA domain containing protein [Nocardia mangyaensis]
MSIEYITCASASEWEEWLAAHHETAGEVWVRIAKKGAPTPSVTIIETLDGALCYGWIDSHRRSLDAHHYLQRYSPRRTRSPWSQVNVAKAEALIAAGRMRPAGYAAIEEAVADGRWAGAYERQRIARTPDDLSQQPSPRTPRPTPPTTHWAAPTSTASTSRPQSHHPAQRVTRITQVVATLAP